MKYTHLKGLHNSMPPCISSYKTPISMKNWFYFTEENKYTFNDDDQLDFNKLFGLKGEYFTPMFNTVMIGWRWNPKTDFFEVLPYFHLGNPAHTFNEDNIIQLKVNEICKSEISILNKVVTCTLIKETETENKTIIETKAFTKDYSKFWFIGPWFGGQKSAPNTMSLNIN